jgi:NAD(P)-dependent dehydrogenase (short-subunit alcohol dehydrogenase family)
MDERDRRAASDRGPRVVVVTGASDGIGEAAASRFRAQGDHVVVVGRSKEKTAAVARRLAAPYYVADFADFAQVRDLGAALVRDLERIDVLANNAGGIMGARHITIDGNELTTQVNHLAPFLLTNLVMSTLQSSRASVICTSSVAHRRATGLSLDDLTLEARYSPFGAYARAKLMNILFARELHRRYHDLGLSAASFHPGIVRTAFASEYPSAVSGAYRSATRWLFRSPARGADTLVWLASTAPGAQWPSGEYFKNHRVARCTDLAQSPDLARALWERSRQVTGLA